MTVVTITIEAENAGERIDKALSTIQAEWSRSQISNWLADENIKVNGIDVKPKYKVRVGDVIEVTVPEVEDL